MANQSRQPGTPQSGERLIIQLTDGTLQEIPLNAPALTVGREVDSDIPLHNESALSRVHGKYERQGTTWTYTDLKSTNGSYLRRKRLNPHQPVTLKDGDTVFLGSMQPAQATRVTYRAAQPGQRPTPDQPESSPPPPQTPPGPPPGASQPYLTIYVPGESPRNVDLNQPVLTIGRETGNDIKLEHNAVSRQHGRIEQRGGVWHYIDNNSSNGTYVNGQLMKEADLRDNDTLLIGDAQGNSVKLVFHTSSRAANYPLSALGTPGTVMLSKTRLAGKTSLIIGRDPMADVTLSAPTVSYHHARLEHDQQKGYYVLTDMSTNGTFVNGQRITHHHILDQDDVIVPLWEG